MWAFRVWGAGVNGGSERSLNPDRRTGPLVTRLSYRLLPGHQTAPAGRIPAGRRTRPVTVLRSAQAFFRDRCGRPGKRPET